MPESNWQDATRGYRERRELISLVVQLIQEYYAHWGRWPSADELLAQVRAS